MRRLLILRMLRIMPLHQHKDRATGKVTGRVRHRELRLHDEVVVILVLAIAGCQLRVDNRGVRADP